MKTKKLLVMVLFPLLLIGMGGCEKENNLEVFENTAIITYSEPAADGCGWKVNVNEKEYHPINLDDKYKINGSSVNVKYNLLSSFWECSQWTARKYQEIKIIDITKID
jgi:hypothetical protein